MASERAQRIKAVGRARRDTIVRAKLAVEQRAAAEVNRVRIAHARHVAEHSAAEADVAKLKEAEETSKAVIKEKIRTGQEAARANKARMSQEARAAGLNAAERAATLRLQRISEVCSPPSSLRLMHVGMGGASWASAPV